MKKLIVIVTLLAAPSLFAQNIDKAIKDFKAGRFEDSASRFYEVLSFTDDPADIAEAQYGLARSLQKLELNLAALKYYEDMVRGDGADHPYFREAITGLLEIAEELNDDFKIPVVFDAIYDANFNALSKMDSDLIQRMHFLIGLNSFNREDIQGANEFLGSVKVKNPAFPKAQYMLGLISLGVGQQAGEADYEAARKHFENVRRSVGAENEDAEYRQLYDLATLAIGRMNYEAAYQLEDGDPRRAALLKRAIYEYRSIPRFSEAWADALFERAWAHTVNNEYGKALGALHSVDAPYFNEEFYPESNILKSIIYYYNCQWDRVNGILDETKAQYKPMAEQLAELGKQDYQNDEWYELLQRSLEAGVDHGDPNLIPFRVAYRIKRDPRFNKFENFLKTLEREARAFESNASFSKSDMGREMTDFALTTREDFLNVIGRLTKIKLIDVAQEVEGITTRASIVSLETKSAETDWLEQGREIENRQRTRLPRPFVPDDTFQFWWFRNEFWIDELGYYEYTIKTECFE
jgi:hypothetical protein